MQTTCMKSNLTILDWTFIVLALGVATFLVSLTREPVTANASQQLPNPDRMMLAGIGDRILIRMDDGIMLINPLAKAGEQLTPAYSFTSYEQIRKGK